MIYIASATHIALAEALNWTYNVSKINIPYFMTTRILIAVAGDKNNYGIASLALFQENYAKLSNNIIKIYARRVNTVHCDMIVNTDGYMTAWFMFQLQGDEQVSSIFIKKDT